MCGIAGWIDYTRNISEDDHILHDMVRALAHRGPDADGFRLSEHALLGHRRLVVVDPEGGRQPMRLDTGGNTYTIVYNGELYNTEDIRRELLSKGHAFAGWSDTEVLLHAAAEWGEGCLKRLNGIYAFAVWDEKNERLFMARDRIGVKPLFYSKKGDTFLFASELKALLKHPALPPRVGAEGLAEIFAVGPARTPGHGVFKDIDELKPGWCLTYDREGLRVRPYWSLQSFTHPDDFGTTARTVRALVLDAVKRQLVSDVPLCVLLSGGLDSSAIAAIAAEVYRAERNDKIRTFSIDYVDNDKNFRAGQFQPNPDAPWVKTVSDFLGTEHTDFLIDTPELVEALYPSVTARDLPGMTDVDSSLLVFSRRIKKHATVGLSGECADEVFGGYPWFYYQADKDTFPWSQRLGERVRMLSPELTELIRPYDYVASRYREAVSEAPQFDGDTEENARMRKLFYLNLTRWMPTLLDRKDRMSMATGLELRVPYCDHRLVEYVWNVPWEFKNYREREKGLLRLALKGLLPEEVLWRKKSPYPKTHNPNYIEALRILTTMTLDDPASPVLPFIDKAAVRALAKTVTRDTDIPWFGQLMNAPQLLAWLLQIDWWMRAYKVEAAC
jgi:asparagine synthase (glutamine-hydrolysing)